MLWDYRQTKGAADLNPDHPVAYFCAEFGFSDLLPIYSGGLGVLAGDILQQAAQQSFPLVGVGLFYKFGYFHQHLDCSGQTEITQAINPLEVPLDLLKDPQGETFLVEVPIHERRVFAQIWRYQIGSIPLYLLDTDHWRNSEADKKITDQLYGGDQAKRLQQELILGIGGVRALQKLGLRPSIYHLNEGHSAFLALELIAQHLRQDQENFHPVDAAIKKASQQIIFTNHTLEPSGQDLFPNDLVCYYLGQYADDTQIGIDQVLKLGYLDEKPGFFAMTLLALRTAGYSNAVSKLHAAKAKKVWPNFTLIPVTNGIYLPSWIAPELQELINRYLPDWSRQASDTGAWKAVRQIPNLQLWKCHQHLKQQMLDEVYARTGIQLDAETLTIVWARRFAVYKRPELLFNDLERLKNLLFHATRPIQIIISGKSHPADLESKKIIEHLEYLANFQLKHRAVFVDDYSLSLAKFLVSGADVWLNTPLYGQEASGTSGMKASVNGVVQLTTPDGWANEIDWYALGYTLPVAKAETEIYNLLERKIAPTFYRRNRDGLPDIWIMMMKETLLSVAPRFSSQRMLEDYQKKMYHKLSYA